MSFEEITANTRFITKQDAKATNARKTLLKMFRSLYCAYKNIAVQLNYIAKKLRSKKYLSVLIKQNKFMKMLQ